MSYRPSPVQDRVDHGIEQENQQKRSDENENAGGEMQEALCNGITGEIGKQNEDDDAKNIRDHGNRHRQHGKKDRVAPGASPHQIYVKQADRQKTDKRVQ